MRSYNWDVTISAQAPDCFQKHVILVGGQFQPTIRVRQGDILQVARPVPQAPNVSPGDPQASGSAYYWIVVGTERDMRPSSPCQEWLPATSRYWIKMLVLNLMRCCLEWRLQFSSPTVGIDTCRPRALWQAQS